MIVASGASARWLGLENEQKLIGHGVSSCATCDGFFYRGKKIMVVGGGDSAMEEANFLTRFGSEVALVHRRDQFRASKIMLDRVRHNPKIKLLTNTVVEDVFDASQHLVTGVRLKNVATGAVWEQEVDGFFVAIGHIPNTAVFKGQIDTDRRRLHHLQRRRPDQYSGRVPCRRRAGSRLPAGHHRLRRGLHGGHGSRAVPGSGGTLMIERLSPPGVPAPRGPYSPAVRAGDFIFVSGQVPVDPATNQVELGDIQHETRLVLTNIGRILEGCGATHGGRGEVLRVSGRRQGFRRHERGLRRVFWRRTSPRAPPWRASSRMPGLKVEIDCIAYRPGAGV